MNSESNFTSDASLTDLTSAAVETETDSIDDPEATTLGSNLSDIDEYAAIEADSGSTDPTASEADLDETDTNGSEKKRSKLIFLPIVAAALILLSAAGLALRAAIPFRTELGREIDPKFPELLIKLDTSGVDSSTIGEYTVPAKILGFISADLKMQVSDTTPPSVTLRTPTLMPGETNVTPEDFVESYEDEQSVEFSFDSTVELSSGTTAVVIIATDESGNSARFNAACSFMDELSGLSYELGTPKETILAELSSLTGAAPELITGLEADSLGEQHIRAEADDLTLFTISLVDTIKPSGEANDLDILLGTRFIDKQIAALVKNVYDESKLSYSFSSEPNWDKSGKQTAGITVTDEAGNFLELEVRLNIHDIPSSLTVEAGTTSEQLSALLFDACPDQHPELIGDELSYKTIGTHAYSLRGEYSDITVEITVEDTIPPEITAQDISTDRGALPYPGSFISSCSDATAVSFSYETEPDVSSTGTKSVVIIATDSAGNEARASATLTVIADTLPPVIKGVKNIYAYEGDTISYRSGVTAEDASDGRVTVYVDSSQVKTSTAGTYVVTYRATDSSGNTATQSAYVYISRVTQSTLDSCADEILDEILTYGMTEREKAEAIYDWCRSNLKYSTVTSHLMGLYYKAAYSGYRLHYGNCYTYYAVARSLLTRAGITNQMIQRNDPSKPHYWNLVKIDGSWYHFDTCPQPYPNNDGCFLLTDAEVAAYSQNKVSGYYDFAKGVYPATP